MKRVYCLYRVSTKGQVEKDDIPMQKTECQVFAERNGWTIVKEFSEKGVSGFKVSAQNRDAIQDLKAAAQQREFDILLVFMFDRLGRRQNETPFVVEWFVNQGIEVWSCKEGQQSFENDVDYLLNYMRYWQASGESRKTSARVKTRLNQLTAEGIYTGGVTPFGYKVIPSGRVNKKGKELLDIVVDESEAPIVHMIFEKTVKEGYGSFRMAEYLNQMNIKTHNGSKFQCNTVNRILKNRMYCGYYISGEITSPHIERLQIIEEGMYNQAQKILSQRSVKNESKQQIARTTKGKTLLSGNIYCAHCDSHMIATSYVDSYVRADGSKYAVRKQRYICCNKARKRGKCDGQSGYVANKIDRAVDTIVREYLAKIKITPKSIALEKRYQTELADLKLSRKKVEKENKKLKEQLVQLSGEIARALTGNSSFTPDMLSMAIDNAKAELQKNEDKLAELNFGLNNNQGAIKKLDFYYEQFKNWADEFEFASLEQKKMIICQLVREINVSRGYGLDIVLDINYQQFLIL